MERFACFTLHLLKNRLRSLAWSERGYPGRFAALLHSPAVASTVLQQMKADWEFWQHVNTIKGTNWAKLRERSPLNQMAVLKVARWFGSLFVVFDLGQLAKPCSQYVFYLRSGRDRAANNRSLL